MDAGKGVWVRFCAHAEDFRAAGPKENKKLAESCCFPGAPGAAFSQLAVRRTFMADTLLAIDGNSLVFRGLLGAAHNDAG